ncbi:PIG-L family deacetylase [Gracilimonas mengyeensis]|uniref:N-acetylglucosaminyl deacetylase, LmbE family n=1 Tax=Gracilimonas mengyeensis TaxID=1302730 RepID=A0A521BG84_9BACT|nr:PIG-L family deacetylase [Gracilimonas mengyeensis]SMO45730.1 N-acetylglucosaminyl deacetylase, LmbE family [Gracilimonas mengyeensis]
MKRLFLLSVFLISASVAFAQDSLLNYQPKVLLVTAHPDDDALFSATIFKTTKLLNGKVDLALMTNGEGGYTYSTLGNYIYNKELDKEEIGRQYLPGIRKQELMAGGEIVGIRNYFFFDQPDFYYTEDVEETLEKWNTDWVHERMVQILEEGDYDFMFLMLPFEEFHGHHKASAVLGLRAMQELPEEDRPIVLQGIIRRGDGPGMSFTQMPGYPETKVMEGEIFEFDRSQTFGANDRMNYNIISNWVIAEHKSQGTMQLLMQTGDKVVEQYWYNAINGEGNLKKTAEYFEAVNAAQP